MVCGKPSNRSDRQVDFTPLSCRDRKLYFICCNNPRLQRVALSMNRNERQTVAWEWLDSTPSVCVRFYLARIEIRFELFRLSRIMRLLNPFAAYSKKLNIYIHNMVKCKYILHHVCVDRYLPRMVNATRIWKLKIDLKDLLFVAFQQKKLQSLHKPFMSS